MPRIFFLDFIWPVVIWALLGHSGRPAATTTLTTTVTEPALTSESTIASVSSPTLNVSATSGSPTMKTITKGRERGTIGNITLEAHISKDSRVSYSKTSTGSTQDGSTTRSTATSATMVSTKATTALNTTVTESTFSSESTITSGSSATLNVSATFGSPTTTTTTKSTERETVGNITQGIQSEKITTTIIIVIAASAGAFVGVVLTVITTVICRRKTRKSTTTKRMSLKRNRSYTVAGGREGSNKGELDCIQILPGVGGGSYTDVELNAVSQDNNSTDANVSRFETAADDYDTVHLEELCANTKPLTDEYSHLKTTGRKISATNYAHLELDQKGNIIVDMQSPEETKDCRINTAYQSQDEIENGFATLENADGNPYSHLHKYDNNEQREIDTITDDGYSHTNVYVTDCSINDSDSEPDTDETYNHLGSIKLKNFCGHNKVKWRKPQKTRSNSLPAEDLQPHVKTILDDADTYDHILDDNLKRAPTYYNWKPVGHTKSKSLPAQEILQFVKNGGLKNDTTTHINDNLRLEDFVKTPIYTVLESEGQNEPEHTYFILEPTANV